MLCCFGVYAPNFKLQCSSRKDLMWKCFWKNIGGSWQVQYIIGHNSYEMYFTDLDTSRRTGSEFCLSPLNAVKSCAHYTKPKLAGQWCLVWIQASDNNKYTGSFIYGWKTASMSILTENSQRTVIIIILLMLLILCSSSVDCLFHSLLI